MGNFCTKDDVDGNSSQQERKKRKKKNDRGVIYASASESAVAVEEEKIPNSSADASAASHDAVLQHQGNHQSRPSSSNAACIRAAGFAEFPSLFGKETAAMCVASGPATGACFVGGEDGSLHHLNWLDGTALKSWPKAHSRDINSIQFDGGSARVFTGSRDKLIKVWSIDSDDPIAFLKAHTLVVTCMALNCDGSRLVSGSRDNSVRLWDTATGELLSTQDVKLNVVHCVRWIEPLNAVCQGGEDLTIRLWDVRAPMNNCLSLLHTISDFDYHPICMAAVDPLRSTTVFTGHNGFNGEGCMVTEWDLRQRKAVGHFAGHHSGTVRSVMFIQQNTKASPVILSASDDGSIAEWDAKTYEFRAQHQFSEGRITALCENLVAGDIIVTTRSGMIVGCRLCSGPILQRTRYIGSPFS